jgi:hypothetical protein
MAMMDEPFYGKSLKKEECIQKTEMATNVTLSVSS